MLAVGSAPLLTGCLSSQPEPDLAAIYNREAQYQGIERNPVILIPGVLGSRLRDEASGITVWGAFTGDYADPEEPEGQRLVSLPMGDGQALRDLTDDVVSDGALESLQISVLGLPVRLRAYAQILSVLGVGGYRDAAAALETVDYGSDHFTCFQFDYDWRRDNVENAQRLHAFIEETRATLQAQYAERYGEEDYDVKFDIVAHSMGGLITRYYLRYGNQDLPADGGLPELTWAGAERVERVVLVGPPNAGSARTVSQLVNGLRTPRVTPDYPAAILGTMPAVYQLLPRDRHRVLVDAAQHDVSIDSVMQADYWERMQWGLADPEQDEVLQNLLPDAETREERLRVALDHQRKNLDRAQQLFAALDTPAARPPGLELKLIASDAAPTLARLAVDRKTGAVTDHSWEPGDDSVLRTSALMDERVGGEWAPMLVSPIDWSSVTFIFADHLEMTQTVAFADNLLYYLLEMPRAMESQ
ncbi:MAG: hypothetical protein AAGF99_17220 [Bacteroidota bacterium]